MQNFFKSLFFVLLAFVTPVFAQMTNSGTTNLTDSDIFMDMLNTKTGVIKGTRSQFGHKLTNKGTVDLNSCVMKKEVTSFGTLVANKTKFQESLFISSGKTNLTACHIENLYILDASKEATTNPICVILDGNTTVNGSIIFETGVGKVFKSADALILGEVIGGIVLDLENS